MNKERNDAINGCGSYSPALAVEGKTELITHRDFEILRFLES